MPIKTHKRKKNSRMYGRHKGTHGGGARKKRKGSGHRGGKGMSGSGKRADHKKTLITKMYGHGYFGKKGVTSRGTKRDKRDRINLHQIEKNIEKYKDKKGEINLPTYKILGTGEVKNKLIIKAKESSKSAINKVKKAGGEIILPKTKVNKTQDSSPKAQNNIKDPDTINKSKLSSAKAGAKVKKEE
ncbi:MAG: uL15m family ribosomal protein [archaeon]